jgi:hypothetical protein
MRNDAALHTMAGNIHIGYCSNRYTIFPRKLQTEPNSPERTTGTDLNSQLVSQDMRVSTVPTHATVLLEKGWLPWRFGRSTPLSAYVS